jgi:histidinol dehydrogenase
MVTIYEYPQKEAWKKLLLRPSLDTSTLESTVENILKEVKHNGDDAVMRYTTMFDKVTPSNIKVSEEEFEAAELSIGEELKEAIQQAKRNIELFHQSQLRAEEQVETMPGVVCWRKSVGIEKVGLYIPGGSAPLFSTILMLGYLQYLPVVSKLFYAHLQTDKANYILLFYMQQRQLAYQRFLKWAVHRQ